ncbi:hypothetical protein WJX73_007398 [Symbiochloris irregularis]|uniref:Uncharacterized protein n=1 Tax=Symbiochloris irregularis TaxID=706552 RepID=A0AAW1NPH5_9CHLO
MSRKNNQTTRKNAHKFALEREKTNQLKREAKAKKTAHKLAAAGNVKKTTNKNKSKGIRLKKGVTVKGIKITDADSKKRAKALLKAQQAMEAMDVNEWEEA